MTGNGMIDGDLGDHPSSPYYDRVEEISTCDECGMDGDIMYCKEVDSNLCPDCVKIEEKNIEDTEGIPRILILEKK